MTITLQKQLQDTFHDIDLSLIADVIYFDGWSNYEESGGIFVFKAIDDSIQIAECGNCVMSSDITSFYPLREVSLEIAKCEIDNMNKIIENNNNSL